MNIFWLIACIALVVGLIIVVRNFKVKIIEIENKNSWLADQIRSNELINRNLADEKTKVLNELNRVKDELLKSETERLIAQSQNSVEAVKNDSAEQIGDQIATLIGLLNEKNKELEKLTFNAAQIAEDTKKKLLRREALETEIRALESRRVEVEKGLELIQVQFEDADKLLNERLTLARAVLDERSEDSRWELVPNVKEMNLINTLATIVASYPDLTIELQSVAWKKVWLPLIQGLCSREGLEGKGGIYKITLKSDPGVCYIGQAVNIKDRWYTHIKKMIGAMAKGGERLYEYRPDEVWWEVIESKDGNLDEDEKYWIDYYCCKEIGLNKKR